MYIYLKLLFQDLLDQSSLSLWKALAGSAYFKSVTVVVPAAWRDSSCGVSIRSPSPSTPFAEADILVGKPGPLAGYFPRAEQASQCGGPGSLIDLPHTFMTGRNVTEAAARRFVHEWAKFRYGIFDDMGFAGDALYPAYYKEQGHARPSVAANGHLAGEWLLDGQPCSPVDNDAECQFVPDANNNDDIICSLGHSLPHLHNVTRYCTGHETRPVPSKQTVLCGGRAAGDVIAAHADFQHGGNNSNSFNKDLNSLSPEIVVVREPTTRYVLAIDTSSGMREAWRWIHKAAHKFIRYDLPVNANLAIVTFNQAAAKVEHRLVRVLSDATRALLADTVPVKYHLSPADRACVECALDTVYSQLLSGQTVAGAHIVLVSSAGNPVTPSAAARMEAVVAANNAKISSIVIPGNEAAAAAGGGSSTADFYDRLAAVSRGSSYQIRPTGHSMDLLVSLNEAFAAVLAGDSIHPTEVPQLVHAAEYYSGDNDVSEGR